MQKNEKKCKKNLHISFFFCNFAPDLKNEPNKKPKNNRKNEQKLLNEIARNDYPQHYDD